MPSGTAIHGSGSAGSAPLSQRRKVDRVTREVFSNRGLTHMLATQLGVQIITVMSVAECVEVLLHDYECDRLQFQARNARVEQDEWVAL